jgi:alkyl sulfatase BDS1-like metallo-beta-lactamase superfamily hydrolase
MSESDGTTMQAAAGAFRYEDAADFEDARRGFIAACEPVAFNIVEP